MVSSFVLCYAFGGSAISNLLSTVSYVDIQSGPPQTTSVRLVMKKD